MNSTRRYPTYKYVLATIDFATIIIAVEIALVLEGRLLAAHSSLNDVVLYALIGFISGVGVFAVFTFHYLGLYQIHVFVTVVNHIVQLVKGLFAQLIGIVVFFFFGKITSIVDGPSLVLYFGVVALALLLFVRVVVFRQLYLFLSRNKVLQRNALILGAGENARNVAVNLFLHDYTGLRVEGFLDDEVRVGTPIFNGVKVLGKTSAMAECVKQYHIEEILVCYDEMDHTRLMEVVEKTMAMNVIVKIASPLYEIIPLRRAIEHYGTIPVVAVFQSGISPRKEVYKRLFDAVVATTLLLVHLPFLIAIAVIVKLDSPGPILFRQTRVGKNGKVFQLFKFRSMTVGNEDDAERRKQMASFIHSKRKFDPNAIESTKIVNNARVTRSGKWLRQLSLDELPQLFNVLRGEMSLVGPRPCLPYEWEQYEEWHKRRLSVLPGLTGIWQVSGRSVVGFEDMVILDLHYIQNASIALDLRVIIKTIPVMLFGTGAK